MYPEQSNPKSTNTKLFIRFLEYRLAIVHNKAPYNTHNKEYLGRLLGFTHAQGAEIDHRIGK